MRYGSFRHSHSPSESNYDLSISDLMSALCGIFLLIVIIIAMKMTATINEKEQETERLRQQTEQLEKEKNEFIAKNSLLEQEKTKLEQERNEYIAKNSLAEKYFEMQIRLRKDIEREFKNEFKAWNMSISDDLTIHFNNIDILFEPNSPELKDGFKRILDTFFPRLITLLAKKDYVNEILEIRIEGHTARNEKQSLEDDYRTGMYLSQKRTQNVLFYCIGKTAKSSLMPRKISGQDSLQWIRQRIAAIGYSNSIPISSYDPRKNRRVEIKIKTKSEEVIKQLTETGGK